MGAPSGELSRRTRGNGQLQENGVGATAHRGDQLDGCEIPEPSGCAVPVRRVIGVFCRCSHSRLIDPRQCLALSGRPQILRKAPPSMDFRCPDAWFFDEMGLIYRVWFAPREIDRWPWHDSGRSVVCFESVSGSWVGSAIIPAHMTLQQIGISGLKRLFDSVQA